MRTITIFGSWWGGNLGDTAILKSTLAAYQKQRNSSTEFIVHSSNPGLLSKYLTDFDNINIKKTKNNYWGRKTFRSITDADIVLIGGGGLFFSKDYYHPLRNHLINLAPISLLTETTGAETHVLAVGATHMDGVIPGLLARTILIQSDSISARDRRSVQTLSNYTRKDIHLVPDPAFTLEPDRSEQVKERIEGIPSDSILLSLHDGITRNRPALGREQLVKSIVDSINSYAKNNSYDVVLYNNYVFSDWIAGLEEYFDQDVTVHTISTEGLQPEEAIALIAHCQVALCSQMHVNIFSVIAGTPNVALVYDEKVRGMMELVDLESQVIDLEEIDTAINDLEEVRSIAPERLRELREDFEEYVSEI